MPPGETADRIAQGGTAVLSNDAGRRISMGEYGVTCDVTYSDPIDKEKGLELNSLAN